MGKYSFVLSDTLYKQYYLFKEHQDYDKDILLHLLKFRCGEFLTNTRQLDDIGIGDRVSKSLYDSLKHARLTKQTLEELARKTDYKLILCDDRTDIRMSISCPIRSVAISPVVFIEMPIETRRSGT